MDISPITLLDPETVILCLEGSADMGDYEYCFLCGHHNCEEPDEGDHIQARIESLLNSKLQECDARFIDSIMEHGMVKPICIEVDHTGKWWQGNGHHRLAVALDKSLPMIPVVFSFDGDYMHTDSTESAQYPESDGF